MINSTTPYKLAEIIRDTWPGLYNPQKTTYNKLPLVKNDDKTDQKKF
jgi:hypothetical protein